MGMPDNVLGGTAKQHMFEAGSSVRGSHNQVRAAIFSAIADLLSGVTNFEHCFHLQSFPICFPDQIPHLLLSRFFGLSHKQREIVSRIFVARDVILETD
jgi:hypothetical protein